jgi:hypothetical protein
MIDESLLKSNFLGRDGFRWWIGQIPPESAHGKQNQGSGWGNRFKVRILGYHPYSEVELPNEDLPWAQVLLSTTSGSGAANNVTTVKISPGDVVFGFFLDGDNAQIPVILGIFGRTSQVPSKDYKGPFQPFTGYTSRVKKPNGTLKPDQSNEQNAASAKSPRHVSPAQAKAVGQDEISYFSAIGDTIQFASPSTSKTIDKISTEVNNFLNKVQNGINIAQNYKSEIGRVVEKIQSISSGLVGNMVNSLFKSIAPILNKGLKLLYDTVFAAVFAATGERNIAHRAGVAAQTAMVPPVKFLQDQIPCITNKILGTLGGVIRKILESVVKNVTNFVSCAGNQFSGALINDIIGKVSSGLSSAISGVQKILQFTSGFSVEGALRGTIKGISGIADALTCGQSTSNSQAICNQWTIGSGPKNNPLVSFKDIIQNANQANALSKSSVSSGAVPLNDLQRSFGAFDILSPNTKTQGASGCYTGPKTSCITSINIFGSNGSGAKAAPIFGSVVGTGRDRTGSIIGVRVLEKGSGYDFPPFVEIIDDCNRGYGASARSVLNDNGEVEYIYLVSEGENYPIDGELDTYFVEDVLIADNGSDYQRTDFGLDQNGNRYELKVLNGSIIKVTPLNNFEVKDLPIISIQSETGSGAVLKPVLNTTQPQREVVQVIDCVT